MYANVYEKNKMILQMQEEDRKRIARDLHDTVVQNLVHLSLRLEMCSLLADKDIDKLKEELVKAERELGGVIEEMRTVIMDIRPMTFDDLSFQDTLERLIINLNSDKRFFIKKDIDDIPIENDYLKTNIFRIVQETVLNAIRHSKGSEINVSCKMEDNQNYTIHIRDDGIGFSLDKEKKKKHFGLSVLDERVQLLEGTMRIESKEGMGTVIDIRIPINS